jgi:hypothetical protein
MNYSPRRRRHLDAADPADHLTTVLVVIAAWGSVKTRVPSTWPPS